MSPVNRIISAGLVFSFFAAVAYSQPSVDDLNATCAIFGEALKLEATPTERSAYIDVQMQKRVRSEDLRAAHDAIYLVAAQDRAKVFREAVESAVGSPWDCRAVDRLFSTTSESTPAQ